jgi:hypothetical protein
MVDLSSTTTNRENTRAGTVTNTSSSTADSFSVRGAANNRASNLSAFSQPTHVQATASSGMATENFRSMHPTTSSTLISNNFSVRGAANNNRASGLSAVSQPTHAQAAADLERATGKSRSILSATSSSSSSTSNNFSVRGAAANNGASGSSSLSQSIHGQSSGRATGTFSGYGHYSAGGVPAYPGVLGGLPGVDLHALGTQTRTAGSWTWTAGGRM